MNDGAWWEDVLRAAARFQEVVPGGVLVGGSAVAAYVGHRFSMDADHVFPDLQTAFGQLIAFLEQRDDWETARLKAPHLILGNFQGVETGLRQLRRVAPLETNRLTLETGEVLTVPTPEELLRIKAWLIIDRNTTRDFIDFVALTDWIGCEQAQHALAGFDACYEDVYRPRGARDVSPLLQLSRQLSEPRPGDLECVNLRNYKGIVPPWDDWTNVEGICREMAVRILEELLPSDTPDRKDEDPGPAPD